VRCFVICIVQNTVRMMKSRRMKWKGHVCISEIKDECKIFVSKPGGKKPLGRHRLIQDNITMEIKSTAWEIVGWFRLTHCKVQLCILFKRIMNLEVYKWGESFDQLKSCQLLKYNPESWGKLKQWASLSLPAVSVNPHFQH
jgi:hypothetical protein